MKKKVKVVALAVMFLLATVSFAGAQEAGGPPLPRGPRGAPPEAFAACKGKKEGAKVQIKTPHGDTIKATCRMIAMPEGPPPREDRRGTENVK